MSDKNTVAVLEAAIAKNPLALKEALDAALADRVSAAIESLKASMFSEGKDEDCGCDDDEDKGSDKKAEKSDDDEGDDSDDEDDSDEELDEGFVDNVLDYVLEAADAAGLVLSEAALVDVADAVIAEAWKTKVDVKDGVVDKSKLDPNSNYRIRYRGPKGGKSDTPKANATHAVAYRTGSKNESAELVELSKDTLKAYVKKADKPWKNSPHGSPEDRGAADSYYGRPRNPSGEGRKPHQHAAYHAGYKKDRRAQFVNKAKDKIYKV
ncbi:MAG: hypothetical protein WAQ27_03730 [Candidatus Microsaccharimonas sp.]